jgi:hypothetical protein
VLLEVAVDILLHKRGLENLQGLATLGYGALQLALQGIIIVP